jgi:GNAT superfamily N-acetyltransferase
MGVMPEITFKPLTPSRFPDLERLFGPNGACAGCWCMFWRQTGAEYQARRGEKNRRSLRALVISGRVPGILAYAGKDPVGWCAIEPRQAYARLARGRTLAPVDDQPVWAITCFFVARPWRGKGVTQALIEAAVAHARKRGARLVEAYPVDPRGELADAWLYTGRASTFRRAGFSEVARRSPTRPIVRRGT